MANGLNDANICLLPKKEKPDEMSQFRPISLCNVSYKIISKVLCQRLKKVLPDRISETQSAFVAGRQITNNVLIAREMFHALRTNSGGRVKRMAIKTDMSKGYDRLEWEFISAVLKKMGFSDTWIEWIMRCVSSVKYHVLFNGQPRGNITPQRENQGKITGMRVSRASPPVSHLLFADDSLFFCKVEPRECDEVMKALGTYGKASGQCINFEKSSLLFGKRIPGHVKDTLKLSTRITNEGGMGSYLGIPEDISGSKVRLFAFLKERLQNRVNGWTGRWLTRGRKEVLIKSILLALPTYVMSTLLLPLETCENLASAIAQFWWSSNPPKRGIHWVKWEQLCKSREEGGIGFRMIHEFNLAILGKQQWRLVQFPDSLLARVLRGRYFCFSSALRLNDVNNPSYGWRSIMAAKPLITLGIRKKVHSGNEIRMWEDPLIPTIPARPARPIAPVLHPMMPVSSLMIGNPKRWNTEMIENYVHREDIPLIQSLAISQDYQRDGYCWSYTKNGMYTVKSGYWVATNLLKEQSLETKEPSITKLQAYAWKIKSPPKMRHLIWQVVSGQLAVTSNLTNRHMRCDNYYPRCGADDESVNHAIFECPPAIQTWAHASTPMPPTIFPSGKLDRDPYPWIIWFIWKSRNNKLFKGIDRDPLEIVRHAESECQAWFDANQRTDEVVEEQNTVRNPISERCMIDGSWTHDALFSGYGWTWASSSGALQLLEARNQRRRISPLHSELEALSWAMECMLQVSTCQSFGTDCKELIAMTKDPGAWPSFSTELEEFMKLKARFSEFSIVFVPRQENVSSDSLAKISRSFHIDLYYIGCSVPVWFPRPTQA
ncbi:uncharacterized protein LOC125587199 [Brassica napus]|uniref:uncharacterized protein LOC125587199 n=1 Tax=Brassica napus TaxID=3708 RepID=UPI00207AFB21|nr:uncharacterized protein LOC125587199 [Brassica napus]